LDQALELGELFIEPPGVDHRPADAADLRMRGREDLLAFAPELLVQLLAGAGADEVDADLACLLARKADHLLREVDDLDRLTHVEDEHMSLAADRACLDDEG